MPILIVYKLYRGERRIYEITFHDSFRNFEQRLGILDVL